MLTYKDRGIAGENVATIGLIVAVAILVVNDHVLKAVWPGFVTGKVSDFAGLFAFPLFFSAFLPKHRSAVYWSTGAAFVLWKSPLISPLLLAWNSLGAFELGRTVDWTDLAALLILPVSYRYSLLARAPSRGAAWRAVVCGVSLLAFTATSYRTTFDYDDTAYSASVSRAELLKTILELEDEGYRLHRVDSVEDLYWSPDDPSRYRSLLDSGHWLAEFWIRGEGCLDDVYALVSLAESGDGSSIRLLRMEHRCPESKGDQERLLRFFYEKLARKLAWERIN